MEGLGLFCRLRRFPTSARCDDGMEFSHSLSWSLDSMDARLELYKIGGDEIDEWAYIYKVIGWHYMEQWLLKGHKGETGDKVKKLL